MSIASNIFRVASVVVFLAVFRLSIAAESGHICAQNAEDAAAKFVELYMQDPSAAANVILPRKLHLLRSRLDQLFDNRYSPDSAPLRSRVFGTDWNPIQNQGLSDADVVGRYFAAGFQQRQSASLSELRILSTKKTSYMGDEVRLSYQVHTSSGSSTQERILYAFFAEGCWRVDVPVDAWIRLDKLSEILKASRHDEPTKRQGRSRVRLQVTPASSIEQANMKEIPRRSESGETSSIWVATTPLLTDSNVTAALVNWSCDAGLGPEAASIQLYFDDKAARALKGWTEKHVGSMLAVVIDGKAVTFARVADALDRQLSICLQNGTLEEAQAIAGRLLGVSN